ncbi:MAG: carboxypeptidase-like regulatory domain-containing protein [Candidatus Sericytochromatia bacterium]|nr:carboxypeptidase-like regulatory domain-containing protein [Candidatus Sericytochromatia bacterium]
MRALPLCLVLVCLLPLACQGRGSTPGARVPMTVRQAAARPAPASGPPAARPAGPTLQAATPSPTPPMGAAPPPPATPVPSGYVAALPSGLVVPSFAPVPEGSALPSPALGTPVPVASSATARVPGRVLSNGLMVGEGEISGAVFEPANPAPRAVEGVRVFVSAVLEPSRRAELVGASDGGFKLGGVALGDYYVRVEKDGYEADSAPTLMRLYPGYTAAHTLFLIVPSP